MVNFGEQVKCHVKRRRRSLHIDHISGGALQCVVPTWPAYSQLFRGILVLRIGDPHDKSVKDSSLTLLGLV